MGRMKSEKTKITQEFQERIANTVSQKKIPLWKISVQAGLHPSVLSRAVHGKILYPPERSKIRDLARNIGFKGECFQN